MKKVILNSKILIVPKSEASLGNTYINKIDFILTDNLPNAKNVGIRSEDFLEFAQSSLFMPIKMTTGEILDHENSSPIGVITQAEVLPDKILGTGVLWPEERPADVALIRDRTEQGEAQISWEVGYEDEVYDAEGHMWLTNPRLFAATLVKNPAYRGRTPVVNFASADKKDNMTKEEVVTPVKPSGTVEPVVPIVEPAVPAVEPAVPVVEPTVPVVEPVAPVVEPVAPVVVPPVVPEPLVISQEVLDELASLREFKIFHERGAVVRESLGEDIEEADVKVLVGLTDTQLSVVKKLVASRKVSKASTTVLPQLPVKIEDSSAIGIIQNYLGEN